MALVLERMPSPVNGVLAQRFIRDTESKFADHPYTLLHLS
jgi:hypothetical protein